MSLGIDLQNALEDSSITNFNCLMFRIILKADRENTEKLRKEYPVMVSMVEAWRAGPETKCREDFIMIMNNVVNRGNRPIGTKLVLHTPRDYENICNLHRLKIVTVDGLGRIIEDYGSKYRTDKAHDNNGVMFIENALPLIGNMWCVQDYSDKDSWYDVCDREALDLPIQERPKWLIGEYAEIVDLCSVHRRLFYKVDGCIFCKHSVMLD